MRDCFGIQFGYFMEDKVSSHDERKRCYDCEDFEKCYKMSLIKAIYALKVEIRSGVRGLRNSLGGSHSDFPLGF